MTQSILLWAGAIVIAFFPAAVGVWYGFQLGVVRGRYLASLEPPTRGKRHFDDGPMVPVNNCTAPEFFIERLITESARECRKRGGL